MDAIDHKILTILQDDAKASNTQISKTLGMVPSAILDRIRKLENQGVIQHYKTVIAPKSVDLHLIAFVMIESNNSNWSEKCKDTMLSIPHIEEVHEVLGEYSYFVKIRAKNMDKLSIILKKDIGSIPEVKCTHTTMVVKTLKEYAPYPINKEK